jgi:hypothetical protein
MEFSRGPSFKTCRVSDEERLREFRERMD